MLRLVLVISLILSLGGCFSGKRAVQEEELARPGFNIDTLPVNFDQDSDNYVLFKLNSSQIGEEGIKKLNQQASWLKRYRYINIIIEGHCDERGTREYNLALGAKRANVVKSYLVTSGVEDSRISTVSYGKERPAILGSGPKIWAQNRRSVIVLN